MSDELKSQPSQASVPEQQQQSHVARNQTPEVGPEDSQQQQQPYHYHGGNNNYSQRVSRGGHHSNRQGQQRGGRYGSNKYNSYPNNTGQYNRYNNGVGNGNRNYAGGYKSHRGSLNAAAAATMQWPGYYNSPPIYYVPPQLVPAANAAAAAAGALPAGAGGTSPDLSSSSSPVSSASGASTPQPKKIEITTKTGQHLDLNALHSQHSGSAAPESTNGNNMINSQGEVSNPDSSIPQTGEKKEESSGQDSSVASALGSKEEAERTRREFLEQIKLRKQALERKKQEEALKKQEQLNKVKEASVPTPLVAPTPAPLSKTPSSSVEGKPSIVEEKPSVVEEKPSIVEEKPSIVEEKPSIVEEKPSVVEEKPSIVEEKPSVVEKKPFVVEEKPSIVEEKPSIVEEKPSVVEEKPFVVEEKPSIVEEKPFFHEEKLPEEKPALTEDKPSPSESIDISVSIEQAPEKPKSGTYAEKLAVIKQQKVQDAAKAESERKEGHQQDLPKDIQDQQVRADVEEKKGQLPSQQEVPSSAPVSIPEATPAADVDVAAASSEEAPVSPAELVTGADESAGTMSQLLERLKNVDPIEDVYSFSYPEGIESPDPKYKSAHRKYTYGPTFLLQFRDKIKAKPDDEWIKESISKIVITPAMMKLGKPRDAGPFGGGPGGRGGDFRKSGSLRNMEGRSNSRSSSKKKSKRMDDRKSNRPYTSRRDRERNSEREDLRDDDRPREEVKPLVPSANRWVPKSKQKKTEKKLAPDGVTELLDKEEAERKMKSLLNKLTLEMFDQISSEILSIAEQSKWETQGETLKVVIEEVFHKACDEPHWSSMYAQLCGKVVKELNPDISDETNEGKNGPKLVLHYLVARCHAEFETGWTDKLPTKEDGSPLEPEMMSDEYYTMAAAKRRGLGLVRFIGFLYRLNLLTGKMMFECFRRLMKDLNNAPSEETLESVVELLNTVGEQFETDSFSAGQATLEGSALLDSLFTTLQEVIAEDKVSKRMKFKLIDLKELREQKHWNNNKKQDGPKTIQQIHEDEERERQLKSNNSRSNSRRVNNSMGGRNSSRREMPSVSKDHFISTRSTSLRRAQKPAPKEEPRKPEKSATNMFSALMDSNEDEE